MREAPLAAHRDRRQDPDTRRRKSADGESKSRFEPRSTVRERLKGRRSNSRSRDLPNARESPAIDRTPRFARGNRAAKANANGEQRSNSNFPRRDASEVDDRGVRTPRPARRDERSCENRRRAGARARARARSARSTRATRPRASPSDPKPSRFSPPSGVELDPLLSTPNPPRSSAATIFLDKFIHML